MNGKVDRRWNRKSDGIGRRECDIFRIVTYDEGLRRFELVLILLVLVSVTT